MGSSRNSNSGLCIVAAANAKRCFCPPLMPETRCLRRSSKP
ncbi:Protein of uncharacterised function (DUF1602) [Vibrio cholerae]|nr:Protein of uncharacterised function (DUF1602) [Vibrio cholerae]